MEDVHRVRQTWLVAMYEEAWRQYTLEHHMLRAWVTYALTVHGALFALWGALLAGLFATLALPDRPNTLLLPVVAAVAACGVPVFGIVFAASWWRMISGLQGYLNLRWASARGFEVLAGQEGFTLCAHEHMWRVTNEEPPLAWGTAAERDYEAFRGFTEFENRRALLTHKMYPYRKGVSGINASALLMRMLLWCWAICLLVAALSVVVVLVVRLNCQASAFDFGHIRELLTTVAGLLFLRFGLPS